MATLIRQVLPSGVRLKFYGKRLDMQIKIEKSNEVVSVSATVSGSDEIDALIRMLSTMRGCDENSVPPSRKRGVFAPEKIASIAHEILIEAKSPLKRGEIVSRLEERGVPMPWADRNKNVGTILWRHPHLFKQIEGEGYVARSPTHTGE
jgi:hypothetical protein